MFNQTLRPLVFFHIAKTGGTSATAALRPLFGDAVTSGGNLSTACLASRPPADDVLYHGHPEHGAAWAVPRGAVTATLLRTPEEQAVSNYLHLLRNPHLPFHDTAMRLGFSGLMRAVPLLLAYQAVSLDVAISMKQLHTPDEIFARLPAVRRFLNRMDVIGCLDQLDAVLHDAARRTGRPAALLLPTPCLNTAAEFGTEQHKVDQLRAEYRLLAADPLLRALMEVEASLVARARARCASRLKSWVLPIGAARVWRPGSELGSVLG